MCGVRDVTRWPDKGCHLFRRSIRNMNQDVAVKGLTCGHCVNHVSGALKELAGVEDVVIDLVANGVSTVHIKGTQLSDEQISEALKKAGPKYVIA